MDWTAIGAVGELLGAIAVVISIGYLAVQVRQNTDSVRLRSFQSAIDRVAAVNSRTSDPHVADVLARGRESYFDLSPADRLTFGYYMQERLLMYESSLAMGHLLKPTIREVVEKNIRFHLSFPGVREWWTEIGRELLAGDFEDEVDRLVGLQRSAVTDGATRLGSK
jgi:hypothetical protein